MQNELTPQEQEVQFYNQLIEDCKKEFDEEILLHNPVFRIGDSSIEIYVSDENGKCLFGSEITIYAEDDNVFVKRQNQINFGTTGSFNPSDEAPYLRTMNAANILFHWDKACEIVNKYCTKHKEFYSQF